MASKQEELLNDLVIPEDLFEIESLNIEDLSVEQLEERLELAIAIMQAPWLCETFGCGSFSNCQDFGCGAFANGGVERAPAPDTIVA